MASHGVPRTTGGLKARDEKAIAKEKERILQYQTLERNVQERMKAKNFEHATLQAISNLLQQNPEYYTIWNYRRILLLEVFKRELAASETSRDMDDSDAATAETSQMSVAEREILLLIREDLGFLVPLLKQYPKCYWIWNHRTWLLETATLRVPASATVDLWRGELGLVTKMLSLDNRNFHGWGYRRMVVDRIEHLTKSSLTESEFEYTTKMVRSNLSNFSAWHNRSQLILRLLHERTATSHDRRAFFDGELELIREALWLDPDDQSLWFYHHYLIATLDVNNTAAIPILEPCDESVCLHYLENEIGLVRTMLEDEPECKYISQALLEYAHLYFNLCPSGQLITATDLREWLDKVELSDPLRRGRWEDLRRRLQHHSSRNILD